MLSVYTAGGPAPSMTEEQRREGWAKVAALEADLEAAQAFVFSARLSDPTEARVVRRGPGRPKPTDGPYAETKEQLGGFYLIDVPNLEAALDWAAKCPSARDGSIEVRPLAQGAQS